MKISALAKATGFSVYSMRRHAKQLFGPDPAAKRRSGYSRNLSPTQTWRLFLFSTLIEFFKDIETAMALLQKCPDPTTKIWQIKYNDIITINIFLRSLHDRYLEMIE